MGLQNEYKGAEEVDVDTGIVQYSVQYCKKVLEIGRRAVGAHPMTRCGGVGRCGAREGVLVPPIGRK